ncbi:MAG: hypothetical protein Q4F70_01715 [Clostridia bacterium]|nr:hypothetical protein [Clostridia bacterium]
METKDNRARIAICIAFVVFAALIVALFSMNSVQKYEISDLTPLASTTVQGVAPEKVLKLDVDTTKDFGVVSLCFKNVDTGDKYIVDFDYSNGYVKDLASTLPIGDYKVKVVNAGKLGKSTTVPKAVYITADSTEIAISFK